MFDSIVSTNIDSGGDNPIKYNPDDIETEVKKRLDNPPEVKETPTTTK